MESEGMEKGKGVCMEIGNTCRECLVMVLVLVFWLVVNGRESGAAGNGVQVA
jgi:hypothetical protein